MLRGVTFIIVSLVFLQAHARTHSKREIQTSAPASIQSINQQNNPLTDGLNKFMDNNMEFKYCVDRYLSNMVQHVDFQPLNPVLSIIGDKMDRLAKAWDVLTAPSPQTPPVQTANDF